MTGIVFAMITVFGLLLVGVGVAYVIWIQKQDERPDSLTGKLAKVVRPDEYDVKVIVYRRACAIFRSEEKAKDWLKTPCPDLVLAQRE